MGSAAEVLVQKIEGLNGKVEAVTVRRNQSIGKRAALEEQCRELYLLYKEKYGVELNAGTLEQELAKVAAETSAQAEKLEAVLTAIESGDYEQAHKLAGLEKEDPGVSDVTPPVEPEFALQTSVERTVERSIENSIADPVLTDQEILEKPDAAPLYFFEEESEEEANMPFAVTAADLEDDFSSLADDDLPF